MYVSYKAVHSLFVLILFILVFSFVFKSDFGIAAPAEPPPFFYGYAWSSNIGWIKFSSKTLPADTVDYGVRYNNVPASPEYRNLSGYAWSSNIGWISFGCGALDPDKAGGILCSENGSAPIYPPGSGNDGSKPAIDISVNLPKLVGFARACSYFASGCSGTPADQFALGGWDGWISLNGKTVAGTEYPVILDNNYYFSKFAWGGGQDVINGQNISPQFPGWIDFGPIYGGVRMCPTADCGQVAQVTLECAHTPYPVISTVDVPRDIVWTAVVKSGGVALPTGGYTFNWKIGENKASGVDGDYVLVSDPLSLSSDSITMRYYTATPWTANDLDVRVTGNGLEGVGCPAGPPRVTEYTVSDKDFSVSPSGGMTARFIRSIRTVTYPDITLTVTPIAGFTDPITLGFVKIVDSNGAQKSGDGYELLVSPLFWNSANAIQSATITLNNAGVYPTATMRLNLSKNQNFLGIASLPSGDYTVIINASGGGMNKPVSVNLKIDNPSGGVVEK